MNNNNKYDMLLGALTAIMFTILVALLATCMFIVPPVDGDVDRKI
jgi:hypothetical protein